jgi:hypothetical protein
VHSENFEAPFVGAVHNGWNGGRREFSLLAESEILMLCGPMHDRIGQS